MQKLTGINSGQNNKSCRIIHNGSNKVSFTFFWFVCDFLRNLQESVTSQILFELPFAERPSERSAVLQCGPWGRRPAAVRPNSGQPPAGAGRAWAGKVPRVLMARFLGLLGAEAPPDGAVGGARRRPPRELLFRRSCTSGGARGGPGGWSGGLGWWWGT
jgi:hypothetical protein